MKRLIGIVVGVALAAALTGVALAVNPATLAGGVELQGKAIHDNGYVDWDILYTAHNANTTLPLNFRAVEFVPDASSPDYVYTGGNTKDIDDVSQWKYTLKQGPPDKDDITDAYAAAYKDPVTGHLIIYFGLDRYANNGDAMVGFWFFQQQIVMNPLTNNTGTFSGTHTDNDTLVLATFTQGGVVDEMEVYRWQAGAPNNLVAVGTGLTCPTTGTAEACAISNNVTTPSPWPYTPKSGVDNVFPVNSFFEGGIDITAVIGPGASCFSSFIAETRSSQSTTAVLKDFALGAFNICSISVNKTGPTLSKVGDNVTYTFTITNTGASTLYLQSVTDSRLGDLTSNAGGAGTALASGANVTFTKNYTVPLGAPDPMTNTVTVVYKGTPALTGPSITSSTQWSINLFQPSITLDKSADKSLSKAGDNVTYTIVVTNTSSAGTPALSGTISDPTIGVNQPFTNLAVGANVTITKQFTMPSSPDPFINTATVTASPAGFPNVLTATDNFSVNLFQPSITLDKSADKSLSKAGDNVTYKIVVTNTSSADTPALSGTISDPTIGVNQPFTNLAVGANVAITKQFTMPAAPDPFVNTATVTASPAGFPNVLTATDNFTVNLFQPNFTIDKTGPTLSKAGDNVTYTFNIRNTSSSDSPNLNPVSISDNVLGDLLTPATAAGANILTYTENVTFQVIRTVQAGDPDPLNNTVTAVYQVAGFPNQITKSDSHSVDLVHPNFTVTKECFPNPVSAGASLNYRITIDNTGDVNLDYHVVDVAAGIDTTRTNHSPSAAPIVIEASRLVGAGETSPAQNTVTVTATLTGNILPNVIVKQSSASCNITGGATRTMGFWKTHYDYTNHIVTVHMASVNSTIDLGWVTLKGTANITGMAWADTAKNSDGSKRSDLCQARVIASKQAVAAILNSFLSNGAPLPVSTANITAILGGTDINAIRNLGTVLEAYNSGPGDSIAIVDADGYLVKPADPKLAEANAITSVADCAAADKPGKGGK